MMRKIFELVRFPEEDAHIKEGEED